MRSTWILFSLPWTLCTSYLMKRDPMDDIEPHTSSVRFPEDLTAHDTRIPANYALNAKQYPAESRKAANPVAVEAQMAGKVFITGTRRRDTAFQYAQKVDDDDTVVENRIISSNSRIELQAQVFAGAKAVLTSAGKKINTQIRPLRKGQAVGGAYTEDESPSTGLWKTKSRRNQGYGSRVHGQDEQGARSRTTLLGPARATFRISNSPSHSPVRQPSGRPRQALRAPLFPGEPKTEPKPFDYKDEGRKY